MSGALEDRRPSGAVNMQPTKSLPVVETAADAFDKDDFDPLRYINEMFPSGVVWKLHTVCCQWHQLYTTMPSPRC